MGSNTYTRRAVLRAGGGSVALMTLSPYAGLLGAAQAKAGLRRPGSLPDPSRPAGEATAALPFDHLVVVMMENHSFDNYLGMLPVRGQPLADGFTFDRSGRPVNSNPVKGGYIEVQHAPSLCTPDGSGSQSWNDTHHQIDGGRMDGFARTGESSMTYWDESDLPFYYSLAKTFCLANRWFCSAPCQTYPNRRFLMAGTAFGLISTDTSSVTQNPPNGTIFDRLNAHNISWTDYFTDVPVTGVIESVPQNNPTHLASIDQFYLDCAAGNLPAVSFVDSDIGAGPVVTGEFPAPVNGSSDPLSNQNQDEENGDLSLGENFVSQVVNAVLSSQLWPRILLVWLYDEHGGWYDHVAPPTAIEPDSIQPKLGSGDVRGAYNIYGPRVPAVVVSGYARPHAVTNVVHDHTSILATIEAKWNLPAMTYRDANAVTMADFLSPEVTFPQPPTLAAPSDLASSESSCDPSALSYQVRPGAPSRRRKPKLVLTYSVARHGPRVVVALRAQGGTLNGLRI
ncbi:MAG TPA: alkaline phosphatase family protein, partial [Solirubrobacteraceae bacterium]|nr:alkaline phosphatase family protein [Solirubrobacteraceae bacterium]